MKRPVTIRSFSFAGTAAAAATLFGGGCESRAADAPRVAVPAFAMAEHRTDGDAPIRVDGLGHGRATAQLRVEIGPDGRVLSVRQSTEPHNRPAPPAVVEAVRGWRLRPFTLEDQPITAVGDVLVDYLPPERPPARDRPFPQVDDGNVSIVLERTPCFGWCPAYRLDIAGDGAVRLTTPPPMEGGNPHFRPILVPGTHAWRIPREAVAALAQRFREAQFFGLEDAYEAQVTDNPAVTLTFAAGAQRKSVLDYVGDYVGMPDAVRRLQEEVDRTAGAATWVTGTADTDDALAAEGFDFTSDEAMRILLGADGRASEALFLDFLARGVPLDRPFRFADRPAAPFGRLLLEQSVRLGHGALFAELARRGWLERVPDEELGRWFAELGSGCNAAIAEALVRAGASPNARTGQHRETALHKAARQAGFCHGRPQAERLAFAAALVRLGADPNGRDAYGGRPLFHSQDPEFTRLMLASGADPNAGGEDGPAILWTQDDRIALILLRAGADPRVRKSDGDTLRKLATENGMIATLRWLDEHNIP